jgi:hypothetical protein
MQIREVADKATVSSEIYDRIKFILYSVWEHFPDQRNLISLPYLHSIPIVCGVEPLS